ncbi:MAG: ATP-dependent DNA helicase RecG [Azospirillum brasilense]|nr:MAG: ATP-dependent DNA helicase RecG [Azospirillum brasilense]
MRAPVLFSWFASVSTLKGVGPAVAQAMQRLLTGRRAELAEQPIPTLRDLVFHLPTGSIDRRQVSAIAQLKQGDYATLEVEVVDHTPPPRIKRRIPYKVLVRDATGILTLNFYTVKGDYLIRQLPVGQRRVLCGTVDMLHGNPIISHPDVIAPPEKRDEVLALAPSYPLVAGLSQRVLSRLIKQAVEKVTVLPEWQDAKLLEQRGWPSFHHALRALHAPIEAEDITPQGVARTRLAYDELLAGQVALALSRRNQQRESGCVIEPNMQVMMALMKALPFTFTSGQQRVLEELLNDMRSGHRMLRLLQGDVGSGKTILAFAAMAQVVASGFQACLMAPTDLLARQHLQSLQPLADALRMPIALLSGKMKKPEREKLQAALASGAVKLVVGTHALFQDEVTFQKLGLVVVDEQHRFGVGQRMKLTAKGDAPHLLQMTATPIPRSLCMTLYGDMEVSSLTERPPGRKPIDTRAVPGARMAEVIEALGRVLDTGEKAYWVCPLIETPDEDSEVADLAAAEERARVLEKIFPGKVALVHGQMKLAEREAVMQSFAFGDKQLLVATTVVEVGVNVPEATVMVVEHAERFGLAQLHQLRGRVGRSERPSRCILLYHGKLSETARDRLRIMRESNDGFLIAEEDLRLRGAGDVLGTRQTGLPDFLLADMAHHLPLIRMAHDEAKLILHRDMNLLGERGRALRILLALFDYDQAMVILKAV